MKFIAVILFMAFAGTASAQRATLTNDTITYAGKHYAVGDTVTLGYGSDQSKDFAFVKFGSAMTGMKDLDSKYSKMNVRIDKVYKQTGKCFIRGKMLDSNMMGKIFLDIEGAIDNKELAP